MQFRSYNMAIKPKVTYACKTWIMKMQTECQLSIFQRKILQKIFGLNKQADGFWRMNTNEVLDKLTERKNTVREITLKKKSNGQGIRPRGRPKMRWEDDIQQDLKVMKICHWKKQGNVG